MYLLELWTKQKREVQLEHSVSQMAQQGNAPAGLVTLSLIPRTECYTFVLSALHNCVVACLCTYMCTHIHTCIYTQFLKEKETSTMKVILNKC